MNDPPSPPPTPSACALAGLRGRAAALATGGQVSGAIATYRQALEIAPDHPAVLTDLGRLALRMGEARTAEILFVRVHETDPANPQAADDLAQALREQARYDEAVAVLRRVLNATPADPSLWNTLGTIVNAEGDSSAALLYFDEALRLAPDYAAARYNRSGVLMDQGQAEAALAECDLALAIADATPGCVIASETAMMRLARAMMLLALGRLGDGWAAYEARLDPALPDAPTFDIAGAKLEPDASLAGLHLLAMGEQGLGDEVLFASLIPDLLLALGAHGRLTVTAEPRLVPLFARSFPNAQVIAHATLRREGRSQRTVPQTSVPTPWAAWIPIASLLARLRPNLDAFQVEGRYLRPDPERVAFWRANLASAPSGRKVGLTWRSGLMTSSRRRNFAPLPQWREVLATSGVQWVNLQYGECEDELVAVEAELGVRFWRPPSIDLRQDLDDLAALSCALDLVIGTPNATTSLAAACGVATWFVAAPGGWIQLGTAGHPWYPNARLFAATRFGSAAEAPGLASGWGRVMAQVAEALNLQDAEAASMRA